MSAQIPDSLKIQLVFSFISDESYRKYNVDIAKRLGRIEYAILLNDLVDQYKHLFKNNKLVSHVKYGDGLMYYTQAQAYDRCGISRDSFESGIKVLTDLGMIEAIVKFGVPPKRHFKINLLAIFDWIFSNKEYNLRKSANLNAETRKLNCGNPHTNENYNEIYKKRRRKEEEDVVVLSEKEKEQANQMAKHIHKFSLEYGDKWRIPTDVFLSLLQKFNVEYVSDQLNYAVNREIQAKKDEQVPHREGKSKLISKPVSYLELSCKGNYANSKHEKYKD